MQVRIPGLLRSYTNGAETVTLELSGEASLADVLGDLDDRFPGFKFRIVDEQGGRLSNAAPRLSQRPPLRVATTDLPDRRDHQPSSSRS